MIITIPTYTDTHIHTVIDWAVSRKRIGKHVPKLQQEAPIAAQRF
jgi:hypothetical protein